MFDKKVLRVEIWVKGSGKKESDTVETVAEKVQIILAVDGQQRASVNLLHEPAIIVKPVTLENSKSIRVLMQTD